MEIELEIDFLKANKFGMKLLKDSENETVIYYDKEQGKLILDRSKNGEKLADIMAPEVVDDIRKVAVDLLDNKLKLRIFVDRSSVEIFIQDGEKTMTSTVYPKASATAIEFFSDKQVIIKELYKWEIKL